MCGIVGQLNFDGTPVDAQQVKAMCDAIVHRGPDDEGQFASGAVGLGMRRLSIIDLSGGHQPMQTDDGDVTIVFNGEIYNHLDIRRDLEAKGHRFRTSSDTESILHAYREYGVDCLSHLNGMFAIAIWDRPRRRLLLARDRLGIKPLYLYQCPRGLLFASEIKALFRVPGVPRDLDQQAMAYFLRYGYVAAPATLLSSVRKLPPAHYLLSEPSGVSIRRYWTLDYAEEAGDEREHGERVYASLKCAVSRQLIADVPLGAFLSGGLDSSSIVSLMSAVTNGRVSTYSIGFSGPDAFHSELSDAASVAKIYSTDHHEIVVQPDAATLIERLVHHLDEPLADSSFVVTYLVSQLAVQTVKVILSGVGGDELFGGYRRYLGPRLAPWYSTVPRRLRLALEGVVACAPVDRGSRLGNYARLARAFLTTQALPPFEQYDGAVRLMDEDTLNRLSPPLRGVTSDLDEARRRAFTSLGETDPVNRMMRLDLETSLSESLLLLTDKMTMAASIEGRVPFLDHELVELSARVPGKLKIKGTKLRHIQKVAMAGHVPDSVMRKKKRGFGFPMGAWLRRDLREMAGDAFSPVRLRRQGLFDAEVVQEIFDAHLTQRADYSDALLALLTFSVWSESLTTGQLSPS
jgi:asparagine synthase (glutamine-hydrolysing)